jgi:glutamine cyclotransferase
MKKIIPFLYCIIISCTNSPKQEAPAQKESDRIRESEKIIPYTVVRSIPHDTTSFTEGLLIHNGMLFESTGHTDSYPFSRSLFGIVDPNTGKIEVKAEIDKNRYFGEGIAFLKNKVYQLTDTTRIGFIYDAETYKPLGEFHYAGDGWAFTTNGTYLIMSNGSGTLWYRDRYHHWPGSRQTGSVDAQRGCSFEISAICRDERDRLRFDTEQDLRDRQIMANDLRDKI